jgi:hypothetical protein
MSRHYYDYDDCDHDSKKAEAHHKNQLLVEQLAKKRENFAGIGTNKAKRRLNKLALTSSIAKAIRLSLEIEDKNMLAKKYYGKYRDKIYKKKAELILDLCKIFKEQNWVYGTQKSKVPDTTHIIYFEIPGCEQISWHFSCNKKDLPIYEKEWDGKQNSTIGKLEKIAIELLKGKIDVKS